MQKFLLLRKAILKCKLALTKYHMETKVVFAGAKRRKTIWKGSQGCFINLVKAAPCFWAARNVYGVACWCKWALCSGFTEKIWAGDTAVGSEDMVWLQDHSYR